MDGARCATEFCTTGEGGGEETEYEGGYRMDGIFIESSSSEWVRKSLKNWVSVRFLFLFLFPQGSI